MRRSLCTLLLLIAAAGPTSPASAAVVISSDETYAEANDGVPPFAVSNLPNTGGTTALAAEPGYSSSTTTSFTPSLLSGTYTQSRLGALGSYTYGEIMSVFSTDANAPYTATGSFSNPSGQTVFYMRLYDSTASSLVFESKQQSLNVPVLFTLGGLAGNDGNIFSGSLTGTLLSGHTYSLFGYAQSKALTAPDGGGAAGGGMSLAIGAVPEQSSLIVWSLLALTFASVGWWKRSKLAA